MPTITLAVQNSALPRQIGAFTAAVQFFRSIGSTIGVAVMGTLLTTVLNRELGSNLAPEVASALPPQLTQDINPQALASPEADEFLRSQLAALPNGAEVFDALIDSMRLALATAIHDVFLLSAIVAAGGVIAALFLPEAPLRRRQHVPLAEEADQELAATEAGIAPPLNPQAEPRLVGAATSSERALVVAGTRGNSGSK